MLPKRIVFIVKIFDAFGYNSGLSNLSNNRKIQYFIFVVNFLSAILFTLCKFHLIVLFVPSFGLINAINELIQYTISLLSYWLIILDAILHRQAHRSLWNTLQQIDDIFHTQYPSFRIYLIQVIGHFSICSIGHFIIYTSNILAQSYLVFVYITLVYLCQIRVFYYVFCIKVVNAQLKSIKSKLIEMHLSNVKRERNDQQSHGFYSFDRKQIKWIQNYFFYVSQTVESINITFGWSQAATILFCFLLFCHQFKLVLFCF